MRNFALVCASLALVAGIVASKLWLELRAERGETASLRAQVVELQTAASPSAPPRQLPVPQTQAEAANLAAAQATTQAAGAAAATPAGVGLGALRQQEMLKDPAYRKARVAQTRTNLMVQYPGLAEELGLTPDEADQLFTLLAENQVEM